MYREDPIHTLTEEEYGELQERYHKLMSGTITCDSDSSNDSSYITLSISDPPPDQEDVLNSIIRKQFVKPPKRIKTENYQDKLRYNQLRLNHTLRHSQFNKSQSVNHRRMRKMCKRSKHG